MIHTINPEYPIYDSNVVNALKLKSYYKKHEEKRIDQYLKNYNKIYSIYNQIIVKQNLKELYWGGGGKILYMRAPENLFIEIALEF